MTSVLPITDTSSLAAAVGDGSEGASVEDSRLNVGIGRKDKDTGGLARAPFGLPYASSLLFQPIRGTRASDHLDMLRGLAAFEVVCFHLRGTFFVDRPSGSGTLLWIFYFMTSLGHQAVMVFFVLSGFLVGANVLRAVHERRWDWVPYLINRTSRLYIVLIPALILGVFWDRLGIGLTGVGGIYGGAVPNASIQTSIVPSLKWPVFVGNMFFLQTIAVPSLGSNGPLWSLSNEFWYYIMFPFGVFAVLPGRSIGRRVLSLIAFTALTILIGYTISRLIIVWLLGAGLNLLPRIEDIKVRLLCWIALALFCLAMIVSSFRPGIMHHALPNELWVGSASAVLIYALLQSGRPSLNGTYARIAVVFAGFSYTLYLVHLPLLVFIKAMMLPANRWNVSTGSVLAGVVILSVIIIYAWIIAEFTEARTVSVRRYLTAICTEAGLVKPKMSATLAGQKT